MFQFTIRDLVLLTVIVSLLIGWHADRRGQQARIEQLETALKNRPVMDYQTYQRGGRRDGFPINTEY